MSYKKNKSILIGEVGYNILEKNSKIRIWHVILWFERSWRAYTCMIFENFPLWEVNMFYKAPKGHNLCILGVEKAKKKKLSKLSFPSKSIQEKLVYHTVDFSCSKIYRFLFLHPHHIKHKGATIHAFFELNMTQYTPTTERSKYQRIWTTSQWRRWSPYSSAFPQI